jgi:hypothetical protein
VATIVKVGLTFFHHPKEGLHSAYNVRFQGTQQANCKKTVTYPQNQYRFAGAGRLHVCNHTRLKDGLLYNQVRPHSLQDEHYHIPLGWILLSGKRLFCSVGKLSYYLFYHFCHVLPFLYGAERPCNLNGTIFAHSFIFEWGKFDAIH